MKVNTNNLFMPQLDAYVALPRCLIYFFWALVHVTFQLLVYPFKSCRASIERMHPIADVGSFDESLCTHQSFCQRSRLDPHSYQS
jgi:hypothetical protein